MIQVVKNLPSSQKHTEKFFRYAVRRQHISSLSQILRGDQGGERAEVLS